LSLEQQQRVSLIWSLLTCEAPAKILADDANKRIDELERCLAQKEEELNSLRDESVALTQQVKKLEMENTAVRSQCGTLKQENAALIRQYSNVKMSRDRDPGVMVDSFAIKPQDILMFGKTLGSGSHAS
jgi:phage shock protein A